MSEQAPKTPELAKSPEQETPRSEKHEQLKQTPEVGEKTKHEQKDSLEAIRSSIEKEADSSEHKKHEQAADEKRDEGPTSVRVDRDLKKKAYKKELHRVQSHLPKAQRTFSKLIHTPTIESVSEVGGKTVARPSGLLGGGVAALVGSGALVFASRYYGFSYNYFVFIALLIGGFFVGLLLEIIVRAFIKPKA